MSIEAILAHYDAERIREFADEGDESDRDSQPIGCAGCDDEVVEHPGAFCGYCTEGHNDIAAMAFIQRIAAQVETDDALAWLQRALAHVGHRWQPITLARQVAA